MPIFLTAAGSSSSIPIGFYIGFEKAASAVTKEFLKATILKGFPSYWDWQIFSDIFIKLSTSFGNPLIRVPVAL
jgi:hypothetical protein